MMNVDVNARWNGIERKVVYSVSFTNIETNKRVALSGYISKAGLYEDMENAGATSQQIKEAKAIGKTIKVSAYRR